MYDIMIILKRWCIGMPYIEIIILYCIKQLKGERTIYSIYHLLKGKKSSQTIQDAHLYGLTNFFRIYEQITRETIQSIIQKALSKHWISSIDDQRYQLTITGEERLRVSLEKDPFPKYINGWKYHSSCMEFWERLSLLVQVISNYNYKESSYIPIQKNKQVHIWLKLFLKKNRLQKSSLGRLLFSELVDCLDSAEDIDPSVLIFRLTGFHNIGLTSLQISLKLEIEISRYYIQFQNILHYIMQKVNTNPTRYQLLSTILFDSKENSPLTNSSQITFEYVQKGFTIQDIAKIRHLKTSTIEDHIVEIALNIEGFSIESFIDPDVQRRIVFVAERTKTKQLKVIKSQVDTANYFEIRLVLAKYGGVKQ